MVFGSILDYFWKVSQANKLLDKRFSMNFTGFVEVWESEYPFSVNSCESEYPKNDESGNISESGKISFSVNLVSAPKRFKFYR